MMKIIPASLNSRTALLLFLGILAVYGLTFHQRLADYRYWMENSQDYVADGVMAMSDMDSYYWLKMAEELDEGRLEKGKKDPLKGYPDRVPFAIKDTPSLLANFISIGKNFTGGNYYRSGLLLIPILAGLFVFPLFFYFKRLGFGASAVLGGLVASFDHAYYARTKMGRVDTDLLNVFFPLLVACFILPMNKKKTWRANIGLAIGAGITMYFYTWWYQQPGFILVYLFLMAVYLLIGRVSWKQILPILLVFLLASGPVYVLQSLGSLGLILRTYVSPPHASQIAWPNILKTIGEARNPGFWIMLERLYGFTPVVFAGFAGLVYLYFRRFKQMIPVTPLIVLGAWSLVGPNRFSMYLAPFIGIGAGVLIELLVKFVFQRIFLGKKRPSLQLVSTPGNDDRVVETGESGDELRRMGGQADDQKDAVPGDHQQKGRLKLLVPLTSLALMFSLFFSTSTSTDYPYHTLPIFSVETTRALLNIKSIVPKHSAMFTPFWEWGYPLMEIGDFATYHDGGLQGGIRTTLTSKAMTTSSQKKMVSFLSYLEDHGFKHLSSEIRKKDLSPDQMMKMVFDYPGGFGGKNVYVFYLEDMIWKVFSMTKIGTWDFARKKSDPTDYVELKCFSLKNDVMTCSDGTVDLNKGVMNDGTTDTPLRGALFVNDGYVTDQKYYGKRKGDEPGYYLQVLMRNKKVYLILVANERLFRTNFNQQFLLGNYDKRYFEEVYNDYPAARVLKVKRANAE
jgi:undecaprenyl-diphosphooligosaccharide--protein glycosyltransferase